ncbi:Predicted metal-dependent phosphohydrolase, HD superfamily [Ruaniaceae bacterium KH17]|nr:Predicted metal-dependent phosphohydrolase, HD superfamily [Ruaniaceae bacterium KH17]
MAILIDPPLWPAHGTLWSHLITDTDLAELHAFAAHLGIPRRAFDLDHYDVPASLHETAVRLGAYPATSRELLRALQQSGLRVRHAERAAIIPVQRRAYLVNEWQSLGVALDAPPAWAGLGESLLERWYEPHRSYHDARHLEDVLLALDQLRPDGEPPALVSLAAAWFHDAVYRGTPTDERDSAALAEQELGRLALPSEFVGEVAEMIIATDPSLRIENATPPLAQLLDADLWILASHAARYDEYRASVRHEYAHVPDRAFATGRSTILEHYLDRPAIYLTERAHDLWESRARTNLTREREMLSQSVG